MHLPNYEASLHSLKSKSLVSFWKHHPIEDQKAETLAGATIAFQKKFNCDFIKLMPAGCWQSNCYGIQDAWINNPLGARTVTKTIINKPSDWLSLSDFSVKNPEMLQEIAKACSLVDSHFSSKTPILCTIFCPVSQAVQLAGLEVFLRHVEEWPDIVLEGLERITNNTILTIQALKDSGAKGIFFVSQQMRKDGLPKPLYDRFGMAYDTRCLDYCKDSLLNIFHIHGDEIYFSLGKLPQNCTIHYEMSSRNPEAQHFFNSYSYNLSLGIPHDLMESVTSENEIRQLVRASTIENQDINIHLAGCVLPLAFPDNILSKWVETVKSIGKQ